MSNTHRYRYLKSKGLDPDESYSINDLVKISGIKKSILQEVYNRGVGAWKTNPESVRIKGSFKKDDDMKKFPRSKRLSKEQWGIARVYSFLNKGKTFHTADSDLAEKINGVSPRQPGGL